MKSVFSRWKLTKSYKLVVKIKRYSKKLKKFSTQKSLEVYSPGPYQVYMMEFFKGGCPEMFCKRGVVRNFAKLC